jgi:phosphoglycerate dehydrogenase-like enzyme
MATGAHVVTRVSKLGVAPDLLAANPALMQEVLDVHPDAKYHNRGHLNEDDLIEFLSGCDAAIIGFEPVTARVLDALPDLTVISKYGNGCETIDFHAMKRRGVRFGYTWGVNRLAVAELVMSMMIAGLRWVPPLNAAMRAGARPALRNGRFLTNRVVGIHGCGHIGRELVRLLRPFDCEILACDIRDQSDFYRANNVTSVTFDELLERSEVLTLHLPITDRTRDLYSRDVLRRLRPGCVFINTCRGGIVDEDALLAQLDLGTPAAACFDVFGVEPAANDHLLRHPNMLATPHIGGSTEETRLILVRAALRGLRENSQVDPSDFYVG